MRQFTRILLLLLLQISFLECAKILGIFVINCRSHHSMNQSILKGLAARGHEVTIISHFKSDSILENFTEILIGDGLPSFVDSMTIDEAATDINGFWQYIKTMNTVEMVSCLRILESDHIKRIINSKTKLVDVLFVEVYHTQCYNLLAHKLKVPVVLVSPPAVMIDVDYMLGNPFNPSFMPLLSGEFTSRVHFSQRLIDSIQYVLVRYWYNEFLFNARMPEISEKYLNMTMPCERVLNQRVALGFYNSHFSFISRPQSPNAIDIAGIHIKEAKPLPEDIKEFIENAKHGVILFSFGSVIKASSIHPEKLEIMKNVFSKIPQRVLWRANELNTTNMPQNVRVFEWLPQRDILEHDNVVAFISHCGLFGTLEAIHTGTPVIAVPFMFDQHLDASVLVEHKVAIHLDYNSLNEDIFLNAIREIIYDKKYKENMKRLSVAFKDRPLPPLDTAMYWSEYIIRHNGAPWLRTAAADMPMYQFLLLDVIGFLLVFVIFLIYLSKCTMGILFSKSKKLLKKKIA